LCIPYILRKWSICYQRRSDAIYQHWLSVKLKFEWLPFFNYFVYTLAQVFWFKVSTGIWALIFLTCIVICINPFVIGKIYIFSIFGPSSSSLMLCIFVFLFFIVIIISLSISTMIVSVCLANYIILIVSTIRKLIQVVLIFFLYEVHRLLLILLTHKITWDFTLIIFAWLLFDVVARGRGLFSVDPSLLEIIFILI